MQIRFLIVAAAALALASLPARAEGHPCKDDAEKLCKDVKPGGGRIIKCLKEHEAELSAACKEVQAKVAERMKEIHEDCHDDVQKLCHDVKPGRGRVIRCLRRHHDKVSEACQTALKGHHKEHGHGSDGSDKED